MRDHCAEKDGFRDLSLGPMSHVDRLCAPAPALSLRDEASIAS
jgi:hypothetical protein